MKAYEIQGSFGLDHLVQTDRPEPTPGPGEVVVRIRAVSLNYRDLMMVRGQYNPRQPLPLIPCSDGVGEVVEVGPGVTRVKEGERVIPIFAQGWIAGPQRDEYLGTTLGGPLDGTLTQLMVAKADGLVRAPEHLSDAEAATLPCAAVTAWHALEGLTAGETVLTLGTGGVSIFTLQLAQAMGAQVIVTSSSDGKLERAREMGAAHGINYRETSDWGKAAKQANGGGGVDRVIELGGAGTLTQSLAAVRPAGTVTLIGVLAGTATELDLIPILMRGVTVQGILVGSRQTFEAMNRAIELHEIRPVVDRVFPWDEAVAAFEHMAAGDHFGKIVIEVPD